MIPIYSHTLMYSYQTSIEFSLLFLFLLRRRKQINKKMTVVSSTPISGKKGRVLIAGPTGFIGQFIVQASLDAGRPTYVLLRPTATATPSPSKLKTIKGLQDKGAIVVYGCLKDQGEMEKILKENEIEIVISAVGGEAVMDQLNLINAIKSVGTIKRFLPSEFGHDINRADPVEPGTIMYKAKREIRQLIKESSIPHTYICCNSIASWPYYNNHHPSEVIPPLDKFEIYGDGSVKAYFVAGSDIGKFTIKAMDDFRTLNKSVHFRPECNLLNMNDLASLWEKKIGRTLPRETITEEHLLAAAAENIIPQSVVASFTHDIFIKGCQISFSIDGPDDVEVTSLYPEERFRTMDECFDDFVLENMIENAIKEETINEHMNVVYPTSAVFEPKKKNKRRPFSLSKLFSCLYSVK